MNTLTEKDLKYYLGTGLKMKTVSKGNFSCDPNIETISEMTLSNISDLFRKRYHVISCKPCFFPLSALTEHLPDGSVPIVELAKIHLDWVEGSDYNLKCDYIFQRQIHVTSTWNNAGEKEQYFNDNLFIQTVNTHKNMAWINEYLYANHFWLGDQSYFEKGIVIDKRTVKTD